MTHPWHAVVATADRQHPHSPMPQAVAAAVRAVLEPVAREDRPDAVDVRWPDLVVAAMRCDATPDELCNLYLAQYRAAALVAA